MKDLKIKATLITPALATMPGDEEIYSNYIANKAFENNKVDKKQAGKNVKEEVEILHEMNEEEELEKATTYFPLDDKGNPFMYTYQIEGFLKSACGALRKVKGTKCEKVKAYKKEIDLLLFALADPKNPANRQVTLNLPKGMEMGMVERPLRASTPQGERVALARSQSVPEGTTMEFTIRMLREDDEAWVKEMLDFGQYNGFLQFRNGGYGRFTYEIVEDKKKKKAA